MTAPAPAPKTVTVRRWVVIIFAVGVALDIVIGISIGLVAVQARDAASAVRINKAAVHAACLAGNAFRRNDLARWDAIIVLLRSGGDSPQLQTFIAGVQKANGIADKPQDCSRTVP